MVFEDGFCFLLFAFCFAAEWGGFFLFVSGCEGPSLAYLSHLCDDHQPAHISLSDTFKAFFDHSRFFVYIHCADSRVFSLSPLPTKKMWKLSFVQVWRPNSLLMRMFSTKSFFLLLIYTLFFFRLRTREN